MSSYLSHKKKHKSKPAVDMAAAPVEPPHNVPGNITARPILPPNRSTIGRRSGER